MELWDSVRNVRDGKIFIFWSAFRPQHTGIPRADGILCGTDGTKAGIVLDFRCGLILKKLQVARLSLLKL